MPNPDVWTIGATAFHALMGVEVFAGSGIGAQNRETPVPSIGEAHCSRQLGILIHRCLAYCADERPSPQELIAAATEALQSNPLPPKRLHTATGKSYKTSILKYWPETMVPLIILLLILANPLCAFAQNQPPVTNELSLLVSRICQLRNPQNAARIERALYGDRQWTLMDELEVDSLGECTIHDKVNTWGINQMGYQIARYSRGVSNTGGRFKNGQDPRYNYSFIEVTAKKNATLNYKITGREGNQMFAVVPYNPQASFAVSIVLNGSPVGDIYEVDGVKYIAINQNIKPRDILSLRIVNSSGTNLSFVIVNYNSRQPAK